MSDMGPKEEMRYVYGYLCLGTDHAPDPDWKGGTIRPVQCDRKTT